jgi:hypothetical protein
LLQRWLGDTPLADFLRDHLGRAPLARPAAAAAAVPRFDWPTLGRLLARPGLELLVVRGGRELPAAPPRGPSALRRLLDAGAGVVVRRAERHDAGLAGLAEDLARDLPGEVHVQLFATAKGTSGFGWHYDAEEVFIVQTHGEKDYFFRRNTLDPRPVPGAQPDFGRIREETTPTMTCALWPGDWLYLPRGWWHVARARTDSLSISLGVRPGAAGDSAHRPLRAL